MLWGSGEDIASIGADVNRWSTPMQKLNDLSRCLTPLEPDNTLIAVIVAVVVISSNGEGDRSVESLEVKVPEGWAFQSDPYRGRATWQAVAEANQMKPRNLPPARNGLRECRECRAGGHSAKATVGIEFLDIDVELPGVGEDGMPGRNEQ
jgi:hypothetical protein